MNESTPPSGDRVNFPNAISAGASKRQSQYRKGRQGSEGDGGNSQNAETGGQGTDALINLVQDLTQQNHLLSSQVEDLKEELAAGQAQAPSPISLPNGAPAEAQVAYLLNQLEFAQQANQRQAIRIESLAQQVNSDRVQLLQLEQDSQAFQKRCRTQSNRIEHLELRCEELQQRLQRQQRYTLQFKTALDKCLEVPPPSYVTPEVIEASSAQASSAQASSAQAASTLEDDLTALVSPLLPKTGGIPTWSAQARSSAHRANSAQPSVSAVGMPMGAIKPLKPEPQVPQMSRFKTTLFTLAHQPQESPATPDAIVSSAPVPNPPPSASIYASAQMSAPAAEESPLNANAKSAQSPAASAEDAFWSDLVQRVGALDTPTQATSPAAEASQPFTPPPINSSLSPKAAKLRSPAEGVDTIFDVVIQGAKAIASQLRPSEADAASAQGPKLPQANATASAPTLPEPPSSPARASFTEPAAEDAAGQPAPLTPQETPLSSPQAGWPSPQLVSEPERDRQKPLQEGRRIIDLPTFLRPQPQ